MVNVEFRNTNTNEIRLLAPWLHITDDAPLIQRHDLAIDHGLVRHRHEGPSDARIARAEVVVITGAKVHLSAAFDAESPIPIRFDFFCGVRCYVAVESGASYEEAANRFR